MFSLYCASTSVLYTRGSGFKYHFNFLIKDYVNFLQNFTRKTSIDTVNFYLIRSGKTQMFC